jgi:hypothetical protein
VVVADSTAAAAVVVGSMVAVVGMVAVDTGNPTFSLDVRTAVGSR